jgi:RNA polymerase sigma-32 factor
MTLDGGYARALARTPVMGGDEQQAVAARYAKTRDPRDAERLVLGNLRLVVKIARELAGGRRADLMDLVQEGNAGLLHAVQRFDPTRGVKLTSYARWWIRAYIMRHIMETSRIVDASSSREGRRRFFDGTMPGLDVSLDAPLDRDGHRDGALRAGRTRADALPADDGWRPDVQVAERDYAAAVEAAVASFRPTLDERGHAILEMRLLAETPRRLDEVGRRLAVSGERARQLEKRLVADLRGHVAARLGERLQAAA